MSSPDPRIVSELMKEVDAYSIEGMGVYAKRIDIADLRNSASRSEEASGSGSEPSHRQRF